MTQSKITLSLKNVDVKRLKGIDSFVDFVSRVLVVVNRFSDQFSSVTTINIYLTDIPGFLRYNVSLILRCTEKHTEDDWRDPCGGG